jgi:YVTN family beta-propeller protein
MNTKPVLIFFLLLFSICSCSIIGDDDEDIISYSEILGERGAFIINEGNFLAGNGSLSFYSLDSRKIYNDIYFKVNMRPLGDVPNSMAIKGDTAYIVVNNSGRIEVISISTGKSIKTINGLISPRNILPVSDSKAYVTSLNSDYIYIIDLEVLEVSGTINIGRSSEALLISGNRAIVTNWVSGNEILVIDTETDELIESVEVGSEPESMVKDKHGRLWVLCSGSYTGNFFPEMVILNPDNSTVLKKYTFSSKMVYPTCLRISNTLDTLYFLEKSVWKMGINDSELPSKPFINSSGRNFYKIGIDPVNSELLVTNAGDYQSNGYLLHYSRAGKLLDSSRTDIIPGYICPKQ